MGREKLTAFFDVDGTLLDIKQRHYAVYTSIVTDLGGTPLAIDVYWKLKRMHVAVPKILEYSKLESWAEEKFYLLFRERIEDRKYLLLDTLHKDVFFVLEKLQSRYTLIARSMRYSRVQLERQLDELGIFHFFTRLITVDGVYSNRGEALAEMMKSHMASPESTIHIGDTEADIAIAQMLRCTSIAVTHGIREAALLRKAGSDYCVENIRDIIPLV